MKSPIEQKLQALLSENNLKLGYTIAFPKYNILPEEVKLSLLILEKHGMVINLELQDKK